MDEFSMLSGGQHSYTFILEFLVEDTLGREFNMQTDRLKMHTPFHTVDSLLFRGHTILSTRPRPREI